MEEMESVLQCDDLWKDFLDTCDDVEVEEEVDEKTLTLMTGAIGNTSSSYHPVREFSAKSMRNVVLAYLNIQIIMMYIQSMWQGTKQYMFMILPNVYKRNKHILWWHAVRRNLLAESTYFFLSSIFGCLFTRHYKLSLSSLVMMTKK